MQITNLISRALLLLTLVGLSTPLSASLLYHTYPSGAATPTIVGGYTVTAFDKTVGAENVDRVASPINGGEVRFQDRYGDDMFLYRNEASNYSWWNNIGEYNVFTTTESWITLLMPANTYAFSFNVGANHAGASGWLTAEAHDGSVLTRETFSGFGNDIAPGFGVSSEGLSCSAIKSITVDPTFIWGVGNFAINQGNCENTVPEPSGLLLFGMGLLGITLVRRRWVTDCR